MRLIQITNYDPITMQLARPIYDGKRRVLLGAGQTIHPKYLERLIALGIRSLFVEDVISKGITLDDMIGMPTWLDTIDCVQDCFKKVRVGQYIPAAGMQKISRKLVNETRNRKALMLVPTSSLAQELAPFAHAVNVALLSLLTAKKMGYNDAQLRDLAVGCLLHDIGKAKTTSEQGHPEAGFTILRNVREFNLLSAHIAYQHHERLDGTGFPRKLAGNNIIEYAQICGLANLYEKLISQEHMAPHLALEVVMTQNGRTYLESVVQAFVKGTYVYPPGTKVALSTGDEAIVFRIETIVHRPVVRVIETGRMVSLEENPTVMITEVY